MSEETLFSNGAACSPLTFAKETPNVEHKDEGAVTYTSEDGTEKTGHGYSVAAPLPKAKSRLSRWKSALIFRSWSRLFWITQRAYFFSRWLNHYVGFQCWAFATKPPSWPNYWARASIRAPHNDNFSATLAEQTNKNKTTK